MKRFIFLGLLFVVIGTGCMKIPGEPTVEYSGYGEAVERDRDVAQRVAWFQARGFHLVRAVPLGNGRQHLYFAK